MKYKNVARELNIRKRFAALTTNEKHRAKFFKRLSLAMMVRSRQTPLNEEESVEWHRRARLCLCRYFQLVLEPSELSIERPLRLAITIDIFSESVCWNYFECRQEDLYRLLGGLRFNNVCRLENGSTMSGEETMLRGLYELVSGQDQFGIAESVFGREQSQQSRAFKYFVDHIYTNFLHLVTNSLEWWFENGYVAESNTAIASKLEELGLPFSDDNPCLIGLFIDCNCMDTSRVGGVPRSDGHNSARWEDYVQRAFYNGWKSIHGLKHQTVDLAHGITIDMFGPTSLRRNDLRLLADSDLNDRLAAAQLHSELQLKAYGDSIYPHLSHIFSCFRGEEEDLSVREKRENSKTKCVRVAIEWNYGVTANLFAYLNNHAKLRVMNGGTVAKIYTEATILRNCHVMLYGGISSNYFDIRMADDMLESYLNMPH